MKAEMGPMLKADSHGAQNTSMVRELARTPVKEFELDLGSGLGL